MESALLRRLLFALAITFAGCVSTYAPPHPVAPLLSEAGSLSVGANVRPLFPKRGATAYVAAAPIAPLRLFIAGAITRFSGGTLEDDAARSLRERNHTLQIEGAAGWGQVKRAHVLEVLAGVGYGRTSAHQCRRPFGSSALRADACNLWVDSRSSFLRPFLQLQAGRLRSWGVAGQGLRLAFIRYDYERLFGRESERVSTVVALEPFVTFAFGFPWGKLEAQLLVPLIVSSPSVRYRPSEAILGEEVRSYSARLIETPSPRLSLGLRADLHALWRKAGR